MPVKRLTVRKRPASTTAAGDAARGVRRARRAAHRADPVSALPLGDAPTAAEERSVSEPTREKYEAAFDEFQAWSNHMGRPILKSRSNVDVVDKLVVSYLNELFTRGESTNVAQMALFGIIFKLGLGKGHQVLPRARRALAGFKKDEPERSEDPLPIEVMAVGAERMLSQPDLISLLSGLALLLQFDLFARPSEMLQVRKEDVVQPRGAPTAGWR